MIRWPIKNFIGGSRAALHAVMNKVEDPNKIIDELVELSNTARKNSILALEKVPVSNKFLERAVKFMVDGTEPDTINSVLEIEIQGMRQRHKDGRAILENMGESCPAFVMIGTVLGLIVIMANLTDPSKIGPGL